jgi:PEP-CTERM motif
MKKNILLTLTCCSLLAVTQVEAQTTLVDWTFDNDGISAPVLNPAPDAGVDVSSATATTIGLTTSLTTPPSIAEPDIIANPATDSDSTPSLDDAWRIRGHGASPNNGNGWDSASGIGTQGAEFTASTAGYDNIQVSFDVTATTQGEGYLQVEYTTDGVNWNNATITYAANPSLVLNNSTPASGGNGLVVGSYLNMVETGTFSQIWYSGVTADLSGVSGVNNNPNFAIEIVNAAEGTSCLSASNGQLNNTSGNWSLDNIEITGMPVPEPATCALFGLGATALLAFRNRRK